MRTWLPVLTLIAVGAGLAGLSNAEDRTSFQIRITRTPDGVELSCTRGCVWTTLTFSCAGETHCSSAVDESRMVD